MAPEKFEVRMGQDTGCETTIYKPYKPHRMSFIQSPENALRRLHDDAQLMRMTFGPDGTLVYSNYNTETETYTYIVSHRNEVYTIERDALFFHAPRILLGSKNINGSECSVDWDPRLTTLCWFIRVTLAMEEASVAAIPTVTPAEIIVS